MRFSVIIPSNNGANRIKSALESIRSQSFTDYEIIVVCDGCDDATEQISREFGAVTKVVNYHRCGLARNDAIAMAKGEYLLFIDDDDTWMNNDVFATIDYKLEQSGNLIDVLCFGFMFNSMTYAGCKDANGNYWTAVWNKCWRREFVKDCKFSGDVRGSDVVFTKQVLAKKPNIVELEIPLYDYYHMRPGSITETFFRERKR